MNNDRQAANDRYDEELERLENYRGTDEDEFTRLNDAERRYREMNPVPWMTVGRCAGCGATWEECGGHVFACCWSCRHWEEFGHASMAVPAVLSAYFGERGADSMLDTERAEKLAALFNHCGDKWSSVVPLDITVSGHVVRIGSVTLVCMGGTWSQVDAGRTEQCQDTPAATQSPAGTTEETP